MVNAVLIKLGHSFSLYGSPSWQITYISFFYFPFLPVDVVEFLLPGFSVPPFVQLEFCPIALLIYLHQTPTCKLLLFTLLFIIIITSYIHT